MGDSVTFLGRHNGFPDNVVVSDISDKPILLKGNAMPEAYWKVKKWGLLGPGVVVSVDSASVTGTSFAGDYYAGASGFRFYNQGPTTRSWVSPGGWENSDMGAAQGLNVASFEYYSTLLTMDPLTWNPAPPEEGGGWQTGWTVEYYCWVFVQFAFVALDSFDPTTFDKNAFTGDGFDLYYNVYCMIYMPSGSLWRTSDPNWIKADSVTSGTFTGTASIAALSDGGLFSNLSMEAEMTGSYHLLTDIDTPETIFSGLDSYDVNFTYSETSARPEGDNELTLCQNGNLIFPTIGKVHPLDDTDRDFKVAAPSSFSLISISGKINGVASTETGLEDKCVLGTLAFPIEYWPYKNAQGNPVWDTTTGENLAPVS